MNDIESNILSFEVVVDDDELVMLDDEVDDDELSFIDCFNLHDDNIQSQFEANEVHDQRLEQ